jgi:hypothetical protein
MAYHGATPLSVVAAAIYAEKPILGPYAKVWVDILHTPEGLTIFLDTVP